MSQFKSQRVDEAKRQVEVAESELRIARRELQRAREEAFPEEPGFGTQIIRFAIKFSPSGTSYDYVALKVNDRLGGPAHWYLTGMDTSFTWKELVKWIAEKRIVTPPYNPVTGFPIEGFEVS